MHVILIFSIALVLAGCDYKVGDYQLDESTFDDAAIAMVQKETGIQLPDGSRGLKMLYQGSAIDPSFLAKIQIPESSKEEIVNHIGEIEHQDGTVNGSLTEKVRWWSPSSGTIITQRQSTPEGNYIRAILCQEGDQLVLYLEWIKI